MCRACQQHVVDDRGPAEPDVFGAERQAHLAGLPLHQLLLFHHDQRQEADAASAFGDFHHVDFGRAPHSRAATARAKPPAMRTAPCFIHILP